MRFPAWSGVHVKRLNFPLTDCRGGFLTLFCCLWKHKWLYFAVGCFWNFCVIDLRISELLRFLDTLELLCFSFEFLLSSCFEMSCFLLKMTLLSFIRFNIEWQEELEQEWMGEFSAIFFPNPLSFSTLIYISNK